MSAVLQDWEIRNKEGLLTKVDLYEPFVLSGTILGREFTFESFEIKLFKDCFFFKDEEVKLGRKSKLYKAFLTDEDCLVLQLWTVFNDAGILYVEGYPYYSNDRLAFTIQHSIGPFLYASDGQKILLDIKNHETKSYITKYDFPRDSAPDLF